MKSKKQNIANDLIKKPVDLRSQKSRTKGRGQSLNNSLGAPLTAGYFGNNRSGRDQETLPYNPTNEAYPGDFTNEAYQPPGSLNQGQDPGRVCPPGYTYNPGASGGYDDPFCIPSNAMPGGDAYIPGIGDNIEIDFPIGSGVPSNPNYDWFEGDPSTDPSFGMLGGGIEGSIMDTVGGEWFGGSEGFLSDEAGFNTDFNIDLGGLDTGASTGVDWNNIINPDDPSLQPGFGIGPQCPLGYVYEQTTGECISAGSAGGWGNYNHMDVPHYNHYSEGFGLEYGECMEGQSWSEELSQCITTENFMQGDTGEDFSMDFGDVDTGIAEFQEEAFTQYDQEQLVISVEEQLANNDYPTDEIDYGDGLGPGQWISYWGEDLFVPTQILYGEEGSPGFQVGCMDNTFFNYDSFATVQAGSSCSQAGQTCGSNPMDHCPDGYVCINGVCEVGDEGEAPEEPTEDEDIVTPPDGYGNTGGGGGNGGGGGATQANYTGGKGAGVSGQTCSAESNWACPPNTECVMGVCMDIQIN